MRASGPKNLKTYYFSTCNYLLRYLIAEEPPEKIAETEGHIQDSSCEKFSTIVLTFDSILFPFFLPVSLTFHSLYFR